MSEYFENISGFGKTKNYPGQMVAAKKFTFLLYQVIDIRLKLTVVRGERVSQHIINKNQMFDAEAVKQRPFLSDVFT